MRHALGPAKLRIAFGSEIALGPGKADLLEAIAATGSISESARRMRMSYRRAWLLVDTMNRCFREPVVAAASGGPAIFRMLLAAAWFAAAAAPPARAATVTVFAAASLKESLDEAARAFEAASSGSTVRVSYGATSTLARQIEAGAPAELFIAADEQWMDYLDARGLLGAPRVELLANTLVLIAPAGQPSRLRIAPGFALAAALGDGRLALADPQSVPAGRYARAALESLGAWHSVYGHLAPAANVRAALALVARAEAPLGIVYATDARAEPRVTVVDTFPAASHARIVYPLAILRGASVAAGALARFLASPRAREIWSRHGFGVP